LETAYKAGKEENLGGEKLAKERNVKHLNLQPLVCKLYAN
jgi:hypothetical protein